MEWPGLSQARNTHSSSLPICQMLATASDSALDLITLPDFFLNYVLLKWLSFYSWSHIQSTF